MHSPTSHAALGEIEVSVVRIRAEYRSVPHTMGRFRPVGTVNERSKKAGVHCVSYVPARRDFNSTLWAKVATGPVQARGEPSSTVEQNPVVEHTT